MRRQIYSILGVAVLFAGGCATPGKDSFDLARELERQNRFEDALPMYEDAYSKESGNPEYRTALNGIRTRLAQQSIVRRAVRVPETFLPHLATSCLFMFSASSLEAFLKASAPPAVGLT